MTSIVSKGESDNIARAYAAAHEYTLSEDERVAARGAFLKAVVLPSVEFIDEQSKKLSLDVLVSECIMTAACIASGALTFMKKEPGSLDAMIETFIAHLLMFEMSGPNGKAVSSMVAGMKTDIRMNDGRLLRDAMVAFIDRIQQQRQADSVEGGA